jgi:hypothetical protein
MTKLAENLYLGTNRCPNYTAMPHPNTELPPYPELQNLDTPVPEFFYRPSFRENWVYKFRHRESKVKVKK